ncbi:kinase domain protein, partial (macronuclear) [Tetrahymena thermophila SB210]
QLSQLVIYQLAYLFIYQPNKIQRISLLTHHNTTKILTKAIVFYHPFSSIFIQFVIYSYISSWNNIGAEGAKDLGTGIAQCKNITTLTLNLTYQLIKPACHLLTCLFIYLLTKQNITNFFTYSSQHNQNTNESHSFLPSFLLHIYLIRYLFLQFKREQYWCRGCKRFRHRNSLVQEYHNFDTQLN